MSIPSIGFLDQPLLMSIYSSDDSFLKLQAVNQVLIEHLLVVWHCQLLCSTVKQSIRCYHRYLKNKANVIFLHIKVVWFLGSYMIKFTFLRPSQKDFHNIDLACLFSFIWKTSALSFKAISNPTFSRQHLPIPSGRVKFYHSVWILHLWL